MFKYSFSVDALTLYHTLKPKDTTIRTCLLYMPKSGTQGGVPLNEHDALPLIF